MRVAWAASRTWTAPRARCMGAPRESGHSRPLMVPRWRRRCSASTCPSEREQDPGLRCEIGGVLRQADPRVELERGAPGKVPLNLRNERHLVQLLALDDRDHAPGARELLQVFDRVLARVDL